MEKIDLSKKRVAFLGLGTMGGILLEALFSEGILKLKSTVATVKHPERAEQLTEKLGISVTTDNLQAAGQSDLVLLCVKPHMVGSVAREIASEMNADKLVVSIAASISTRSIEQILGSEIPVVRAMPNTPCVVRSGMTGICKGRYAQEAHLEVARTLFEAVGKAVVVDEKQMDAVTGLSGSGPAFIYIILESLAEAGVKVGLPRDVATLLAAQTVQGAARMTLETGQHPALLKDAVTTPAGCTIEGILALEEGKLRVTLINAIVKATERAKELAEDN
jgi:pyrroline-5-carboxylate reductase